MQSFLPCLSTFEVLSIPWKHNSSQDEISNKNYPKIIQAIENAIKERKKAVAKCFNLQGYIPLFCVQIKGDQISNH